METVRIEFDQQGQSAEFVRPRFSVDWGLEGDRIGAWNDATHGNVGIYDAHEFRHVSVAELSALIRAGTGGSDIAKGLFGEIIAACFLNRGLATGPYPGIHLNDGIIRHGQTLTVFKGIGGKIKEITEAMYDSIVGYAVKDGVSIERRDFLLERLFRGHNSGALVLRDLAWYAPDLVEYLFEVGNFRALPTAIQVAQFVLPADSGQERGEAIHPLSVDIPFVLRDNGLPRMAGITFAPFSIGFSFPILVRATAERELVRV